MTRWAAIFGLLVLSVALDASAAAPQTKITIGYTPVADTVSSYAAQEEGIFARHGLDAKFQLVGSSAILVTSLVAQSVDIASITPAVLLQAVDGGIDLVVVSGAAVSTHSQRTSGVLARNGSNIHKAADFIGKKVAVVALRSSLHIQFARWLSDQGVDPKKVTFVEAAYATHLDLFRGGSVDAVVNSEPFISRIAATKTGYTVSYLSDRLPEGTATVIYVATRDWVKAHPAAVKAFQQSIVEGVQFTAANAPKARSYISKYLKLPPEAVTASAWGHLQGALTPAQLQWWVDTMTQQGLLRSHINTTTLVIQ